MGVVVEILQIKRLIFSQICDFYDFLKIKGLIFSQICDFYDFVKE